MPLDAVAQSTLPHLGNTKAPILVILDPTVGDSPRSSPLSNADVDWFKPRIKEFAKIGKDKIQFLSCAPTVTPEQWGSDKLMGQILKEHEEEFIATVQRLDPKVIVPMGGKACKQVIGRSVQITKVRGTIVEDSKHFAGIPVFPLTSPFYARKHPEADSLFCADLETLGRIASSDFDTTATSTKLEMDIEWCFDISHLLKNPPRLVSLDIEGVGLKAFDPATRMLTVQLTTEEGKAVVIPIDYDAGNLRHHKAITFPMPHKIYRRKIVRQLKQLLENPAVRVIGQNLKFDWHHLFYKLGIQIANYYGDTLLLAHMLDENMMSKNIDDLVRVYVPEMAGYNDELNHDPEHHSKTRMDLLTPGKFLRYAGGDTIAAFSLYNRLLRKIKKDRRLYQCYRKTVMRAIRAFCYVELNGFTVNVKALHEFEVELTKIQERERTWLLSQIPNSIKNKWKDSGVGLKPDREAILIDYLYEHKDGLRLPVRVKTKTGKPSVSTKMAMPYYVADYPFVARLVDYIKNEKMLSTYVKGFYKYIVDGKIRPTFQLHIAATGRSSSRDPNGQNFPKRGKMAKIFRRIFQAPKGWVYGQNDLSQAELRIAAMISGDETMMAVYQSGGDIHRTTAAGVMGITLEEFFKLDQKIQGEKRFQAKAVNFGFLYGMWWKKFREYAKTDYGVDFTDEEAAAIREQFFRTYPRLAEWHRAVENFVRRHGFVRAYNGRVRHLPMVWSPDEGIAKQAVRQAINSPVQSIASDLGLMAIGLLVPYLRRTGKDKYIKVCGFIHDSIVYLVRNDKAAYAARLIKKFMENLPLKKWFGWEPSVPIIADVEMGPTLADTYELSPKYYSQESGNKSFEEMERAYLIDTLPGIRKKMEKAMVERNKVEYFKLVDEYKLICNKTKRSDDDMPAYEPVRKVRRSLVAKTRPIKYRKPTATGATKNAKRKTLKRVA